MNNETRIRNTREAALLVNNDEALYNAVREIDTITELSEFFIVHIAPRIREGIKSECYTLHDVNFSDFLELIDFGNK